MAETRTAMRIATRPATPEDFDYCAKLYFAAMDATIRQLNRTRPVKAGLRS